MKFEQKFGKGQKVRITNKNHPHYGHKGKIGAIISYDPKYDRYRIDGIPSEWESGDLELYIEPETKELNLCELLKGYEGELFYHLMYGYLRFMTISADGLIMFDYPGSTSLYDNGKYDLSAEVVIYPSRALYEQYPLDAYTAWMKWQEEQTIYHIRIEFQPYDERGEMKCGNMGTLHFNDLKFRTPADRDKCIEEIKAIIEKYSK